MEKIKFILIAIFLTVLVVSCCPNSAISQNSNQTAIGVYTLDPNKLSPQARAEIEQQSHNAQVANKIEQYGKWAGMGKEVGIAVSEGLNAVVDVADKFGNTRVGEITIALIIWKVFGTDVVRYLIGILLIAIAIIFVLKSYFRTFTQRKIKSRSGWWIFGKREYEYLPADAFWKYPNAAAMIHVLVIILMIGISAVVMFA